MPRPTTTECKPVSPPPASMGTVGQKAAVTFGNPDDIGKALRAARKACRAEMEMQAETFQLPMFEL